MSDDSIDRTTDEELAVAAALFIRDYARTAMLVSVRSAELALRQAQHEATIAPIFAPSEYQRAGDSFEDTERLLGAFLTFRRELERIAEKQR